MTDQTASTRPAMSPRHRRLMADYESIRAQLAGHPHIQVEPLGMMPPELYRITYRLSSLRLDDDQPFVADEHVVELRLPLGYPREQPLAIPKTEVFHPNIDATKYCIADYWSAGQALADIIVKIGDMLQFRVHNIKSPLNGLAARWVAENESLLPIGNVELGAADFDIEIRPTTRTDVDADDDTAGTDAAEDEPATPAAPIADDEDFSITLRGEPTT